MTSFLGWKDVVLLARYAILLLAAGQTKLNVLPSTAALLGLCVQSKTAFKAAAFLRVKRSVMQGNRNALILMDVAPLVSTASLPTSAISSVDLKMRYVERGAARQGLYVSRATVVALTP